MFVCFLYFWANFVFDDFSGYRKSGKTNKIIETVRQAVNAMVINMKRNRGE